MYNLWLWCYFDIKLNKITTSNVKRKAQSTKLIKIICLNFNEQNVNLLIIHIASFVDGNYVVHKLI